MMKIILQASALRRAETLNINCVIIIRVVAPLLFVPRSKQIESERARKRQSLILHFSSRCVNRFIHRRRMHNIIRL
jgi:hypothetical protein